MSRADTLTKLPLASWAKQMGVNPLHFAGVNIPEMQVSVVSTQAWYQHRWQDNDRVSREEVAEAIRSAEDDIEELLGYRLLPSWDVDEWIPTTRYYRPEMVNVNDRDVRGRWQHVEPHWGFFLTGGVEARDAISLGVPIAWSSTKLPTTYKDRGTVSAATTVTDPAEIRLFYTGKSGAPEWEIRPINVSIAGGTATITFNRELVITEAIMEAQTPGEGSNMFADGEDDAQFETFVDVYRVYNDPQQQASLLWEPETAHVDVEGFEYTVQTAALAMHGDPRWPAVTYRPATWNATTLAWDYATYAKSQQPDLVRLWYYSGFQDKRSSTPKLTMDKGLARAVSVMAAARLSKNTCGGVDMSHWQADLGAEEADGLSRKGVPANQLSNPFGTRMGEVTAYRAVRPRAKGQSISA